MEQNSGRSQSRLVWFIATKVGATTEKTKTFYYLKLELNVLNAPLLIDAYLTFSELD